MLDVLHEDAHCLAVNKPAGVPVQGRSPNEESLEAAVRRHLAPGEPLSAFVGIVHRLDRPVSGVVLWAKTVKAARRLAEQFAARGVVKEYRAVVSPVFGPDAGRWEDFLYEGDTGLGRVQVCHPGTPRARRAETRFRREAGWILPGGCSALTLWPETGRTHQLRVQSGSRGHPIVGDALYGSTRGFPSGIALHAARLTVDHPTTAERWTIEAPPPASWAEAGIVEPPAP